MWPALFRIPLPEFMGGGYFPIRMFGVMVILGFLAGTWVVTRRLRKVGIVREATGNELTPQPGTLTKEDVFDFCFYLLAAGIAGSRLLYVLQNFESFEGKLFDVFAIWKGGLVWYGGFALATLYGFWWLWRRKLPALKVMDAAALGVALGLAIGRGGCFCAGDDYGRPILDEQGQVVTDPEKAPWYAIRVPSKETLDWRWEYTEFPRERAGQYLHASQIHMSLKNLVVFGALLLIARRSRRSGILAASYLLLYPVGRFVIEYWRGDEDRGVDVLGTGLSFSQFFGIFIFLGGVALLRSVKANPPDAPAGAAT